MSSELQLDVCCRSCCGGDIWWTLTKERQAWCYFQVKLCDPRLSALSVVATINALYKFTSFLFLLLCAPIYSNAEKRCRDKMCCYTISGRLMDDDICQWASPNWSSSLWYLFILKLELLMLLTQPQLTTLSTCHMSAREFFIFKHRTVLRCTRRVRQSTFVRVIYPILYEHAQQ